MDELSALKQANTFIRTHKKEICSIFADISKYPPVHNPTSYFMAGSPGAGKTEYSKAFIKILCEKEPERKIVRIDADEIRDHIPFYNGKNSYIIQPAASLGVEKILDYVFKNDQDFLLDGTLASFTVAYKDITRSLRHHRKVGIVYIYQDPLIAWDFTKKRELVEGRSIPKKAFIEAFFLAEENVRKLKKEFGSDINLTLVIRNINQGIEKSAFNIDTIDSYLKISYTPGSLDGLLEQG